MEGMVETLAFYRGKRVLITGHTGFKGSWLALLLADAGAEVCGVALPAEGELFALTGVGKSICSELCDVRDLPKLQAIFDSFRPELVLHLAAQPLVLTAYREPALTYETNVMGTVNVLECVRHCDSVHSVLNVTTDKVYQNREWPWGYRETDTLDGFDPYSNSKSCSELVTHSYRDSFLSKAGVAVSTARAGNVIGGGDMAENRILPDCIRAAEARKPIVVRNPYSVRPYQHVLEPLAAYLLIAKRQWEDASLADAYNVGPGTADCVSTGTLATAFCEAWGDGASWIDRSVPGAPHESGFLMLDCSRIRHRLGWQPRWNIAAAVEKTVEWTRAWRAGEEIGRVMLAQSKQYSQSNG